MKPKISPVNDPVLNKNLTAIREALCGGLSIDNMLFQVISGTTASTLDSPSQIIHSMTPRPIAWFPLIGDVYVQEINDKYIDVRSTKPGVNFKIILIGGPPVTGESLKEVGSSSYQTTTQVIQQTPTIQITEVTDATIQVQPVVVRQSVNENAHNASGVPTATYHSCVADDDYFYITGATNAGVIHRISRSTGICDTLTLTGSVAYGPMIINGRDLYVSPIAYDGATTINIRKVNLDTWTSTSVAMTLISNSQNIVDIYVDGSSIYLAHSTAGTVNSRVSKCAIGGGAGTQLTLESTNCWAKKIIPDPTGTYIYVISRNTGVATNIYKVDKASMTIVTTYTTANIRATMRQGVLLGDSLWMPASLDTGRGTASQNVAYPTLMVELNVTTGAFTYHPYIELGNANAATDVAFTTNLIEQDSFLYSISGESGGGCYVGRYDTLDNTQAIGWFPFLCGIPTAENSQGSLLVKDTDGSVIITNLATNTRPRNFQWFKPDFSNFT